MAQPNSPGVTDEISVQFKPSDAVSRTPWDKMTGMYVFY